MELRSGRRLCSTWGGPGPDHISTLPDDLLLLILARLRCAATAARTSVLSRRWRDAGLWTRIRDIVLRGVEFHDLERTVGRMSPVAVSVLEIHVIPDGYHHCKAQVNSLLRAAARLDPQEFVFYIPLCIGSYVQIAIPCFRRATSIVLDMDSPLLQLPFQQLDGVEFPALHTLSISAFYVDLEGLLPRCPRLRLLKLSVSNYKPTLRSQSLHHLILHTKKPWVNRLEIAAPELQQLTLSISSRTAIHISISAPLMENVSWQCCYIKGAIVLGPWCLEKLMLLHTAAEQQLHIHASICRRIFRDRETYFTHEIDKHLVAAFSALDLHLATSGHVFGAFVFHVIGMNRIRTSIKSLKLVLQGSTIKEEGCPTNCSCDPPNWKTQNVSLIALEEMEIDGFNGEDHEYDFLKLVFMSAPILKRVIVKLSHEDPSSNHGSTELYEIFRAYASVECVVLI